MDFLSASMGNESTRESPSSSKPSNIPVKSNQSSIENNKKRPFVSIAFFKPMDNKDEKLPKWKAVKYSPIPISRLPAATSANNNLQTRGKVTPQKIPRPPNAFMIFANEWRKKLALQNPRESNKEISVRLGGMWKSMVKEVKDKYFSLARQVDAEHKRKYPDYVYNPKEARIRKAMRDQANRARAVHHQNQRQQQQHHHPHHLQAHNRQQHAMHMGARNEIINRTRLNSLPRQTSTSNVQSNHKMPHLLLNQHVIQHKSSHVQLQQVNHEGCSEACNQQWMVGLDHRGASQHSQQQLARSHEQIIEKKKASIREQVEQGMLDDYDNFMGVETIPYQPRAVEVPGNGGGEVLIERSTSDERSGMGSQITIPNGQEFTVFTDVEGHQHWYPYIQAEDIKIFNGGSPATSWSHHQEQHQEQQLQQHLMHHENHNTKVEVEQQQLFPLQCLVESDASSPIQGKTESTVNCTYQRIIAVPSNEMNGSGEESLQAQQYFICPSVTPHPQVKFSVQPKAEMEDTKENSIVRDISQTSSTDGTSSAIKTNSNINHPTQEELGQRNPDSLPLPAFQQAFGSTEIGRFANEGFLSQNSETPSWNDQSSPYGLSSPTSTSNPNAAYCYSPPRCEEIFMTHALPFPPSLANYFDCAMLDDMDGSGSGYGDLMGLSGADASGLDFLNLHVPSMDNSDQEGDNTLSAIPEDIQAGLLGQESSDISLLTPLRTSE